MGGDPCAALFKPFIAKEANKVFKRLWMCCHSKHKRVKTAGPPALTIVLQQVRLPCAPHPRAASCGLDCWIHRVCPARHTTDVARPELWSQRGAVGQVFVQLDYEETHGHG